MMKTKNLNLLLTIAFLILAGFNARAQNMRLINLNDHPITAKQVNYYALDIIDSREVNSMLGIECGKDDQEVALINFNTEFRDALTDYFKIAYPAQTGKTPVILNFKKLWLSELLKDDTLIYKCEIQLDFLTPKKQLFYQCNQSYEVKGSPDEFVHKSNILLMLDKCMQMLDQPEIQAEYFVVLGSDQPADAFDEKASASAGKMVSTNFDDSKTTTGINKPIYRIAFQGGYTYRFGKIPSGIDNLYAEHLNRLKNGFHLGSDMNFYSSASGGFGGSFSYSNAKSTIPNITLTDNSGNVIGSSDMTEDISLIYVGSSYLNRKMSASGKSQTFLTMTIGYYAYNETLSWMGDAAKITGGTFGFGFSLGADFLTSDTFALGFQFSAQLGWIKKLSIDGSSVDLQEPENISRFDVGFGIRFLK